MKKPDLTLKGKFSKRQDGFTLIELMLIVVILSVVIAISSPVFMRSYRSLSQEVVIERFVGLMLYARERAILERKVYRIGLNSQKESYWLMVQDDKKGNDHFRKIKDKWGRVMSFPEGTDMRTDLPFVFFYPDGTTTKMEVELFTPEGDLHKINVNPMTGKVKTFLYES